MTAWKLLGITCIVAPLTASATIFSTDFESDAVGATTEAGDLAYIHPGPGGIVRDSSVNQPFGPDNRYLQFGGLGGSAYRSIFAGAPLVGELDEVLGISFRFYQLAGANWGNNFGVAQGPDPWIPDLNSALALFTFQFREGNVNAGDNTTLVSGSLPGYNAETPYTVTYYMNWSGATKSVTGPGGAAIVLDDRQAAIWLYDEGAGTLTSPAIVAGALDATENHVSLVFRNFSNSPGNDATAYIDDVSITVIPEPTTYAAIFGLAALSLLLVRRRLSARADR